MVTAECVTCGDRGKIPRAIQEAEQVAMSEDWNKLTAAQLRERCAEMNVDPAGSKADMLARLEALDYTQVQASGDSAAATS